MPGLSTLQWYLGCQGVKIIQSDIVVTLLISVPNEEDIKRDTSIAEVLFQTFIAIRSRKFFCAMDQYH